MRRYLVPPFLALFLLMLASCGRQEGELYRIARDPTWRPEYFGQSQGAVNTFLSALLIQVAKERHFRVQILDMPEQQLFFALNTQEVDAVITARTPDSRSRKIYDFSEPILNLGSVLVVLKKGAIKNMSDLEGKIIGISPFDQSVLLAMRVTNSVIRPYDNPILALEAVRNREVDGVLINALTAQQLIGGPYQEILEIVTAPLDQEAIRLAVLRGEQKKLLEYFNGKLTHLRDESLYQKFKRNFLLLPNNNNK